MKINFNKLAKNYLVMISFTVLFLIAVFKEVNLIKISDSLAVVGIITFALACFKTSKYLGFYDLFIFGGKKLLEIIFNRKYSKAESKTGEYYDYIKQNKKTKDFLELYINSVSFFIVSAVITFFG